MSLTVIKMAAVIPILLMTPLELAFGQTFNVKDYGATGSINPGTCSGQVGSSLLTGCQSLVYDWQKGQVIRIKGGGPPPASRVLLNGGTPLSPEHYADPPLLITATRLYDSNGKLIQTDDVDPGTAGHTYCYSVSISDPLQGVSTPSPITCTPNDPPGHNTIQAYAQGVDKDSKVVGEFWPSTIFLWYVSKDGGKYQLLGATQGSNTHTDRTFSFIDDFGQAFAPRTFILPDAQSTLATRGGWPTNISSPDISKNEDLFATIYSIDFTGAGINVSLKGIEDNPEKPPVSLDSLPPIALGATLQAAEVTHDDTQAVQHAINAADNAGGGVVAFGAGTYYIRRPYFIAAGSPDPATQANPFSTLTTNLSNERYNFTGFSFLSISNGNTGVVAANGRKTTGHVHLNGLDGPTLTTILQTPPDQAGYASVFGIGTTERPEYIPNSTIGIYPVMKGASTVKLLSGKVNPGLQPGDDVMLFSGTFGTTNLARGVAPSACKTDTHGIVGGCHYSELNTIIGVDAQGNYILKYPASKSYYVDDLKSDYGMIQMLPASHDVELYHMAINTYDHVTSTGNVYDFTVDAVHINGYAGGGSLGGGGAFGGGYKRNAIIKNSVWGLGDGESGASAEEEYDKFAGLQIINNWVVGDAPVSSFGPSSQARLFATEGTSNVTYYSNSFDNVSLAFDQTTDVTINSNHFHDGNINLGDIFGLRIGIFDSDRTWSYTSFGSQALAAVTSNVFTVDRGYSMPWVVRVGHFDNATIMGNTINYYNAGAPPGMILTASGTVNGNTVYAPSASALVAIAAQPDKANQGMDTMASVIRVTGNTVSASSIADVVLALPASVQPTSTDSSAPPNPPQTLPNPTSLSICASGNSPSGLIGILPPSNTNPIPVTVQNCQ